MKTAELTGAALDWAVAKCEEKDVRRNSAGFMVRVFQSPTSKKVYSPSQLWAQGGPIIERECINLNCTTMIKSAWSATSMNDLNEFGEYGQTPLIAAMRCYVASKLGNDVDVPEELAP